VIRYLCGEIKDEAVSLVDVIAPADHILYSPIGQSNGEAYKNLWNTITTTPKSLSLFFFFFPLLFFLFVDPLAEQIFTKQKLSRGLIGGENSPKSLSREAEAKACEKVKKEEGRGGGRGGGRK